MHFPSQKTFSLLIMKLDPPFWGPFKIEKKNKEMNSEIKFTGILRYPNLRLAFS